MSYYYKYNFVSPQPLLAEIKEEMDSYFATGVVDDVMFYTYLNKALRKLGRTTLKIDEIPLTLENYEARLPNDFEYVRELWLCTEVVKSHPMASAYYDQRTCKVVADWSDWDPCNRCDTCTDHCTQSKSVVYKTTGEIIMKFSLHSLLTPGNISVKNHCDKQCMNFEASSPWTFDIRDNKIITNFCDGHLYLIYYKMEKDEDEFQMIPDNFRIEEFIKAYIKCKLYERIWNSTTGETYNQTRDMYLMYEQKEAEAFILAQIETKKPTIQQNINRIKTQNRRFNKYRIR